MTGHPNCVPKLGLHFFFIRRRRAVFSKEGHGESKDHRSPSDLDDFYPNWLIVFSLMHVA
jgi:hypothetical protein